MLFRLFLPLIARAEARLGVPLDYVRQIARTDPRLLMRYNRLFGFLDPNRHVPAAAYHTARLRGALAADCGTCVQAEIALARAAGLSDALVDAVLRGQAAQMDDTLGAVAALADAVVRDRQDAPEARATLRAVYGDAGVIELAYAMNGAALLPGIKRAMGHATACDLGLMRAQAKDTA